MGSTFTVADKPASDGLFTVQLDFGGSSTSQARYLEIGVRPGASTDGYTPVTPLQELTDAPHAWYARTIPLAGSGSATTASRSDHDHWGQTRSGSGTGLVLEGGTTGFRSTGNFYGAYSYANASSGPAYGVYGQSASPSGTGVFGYASPDSGETYGVFGQTFSTEEAGVVAKGKHAGADLILGGNAHTSGGDDGRIHSDPDYSSSDIVLVTNDTIREETPPPDHCGGRRLCRWSAAEKPIIERVEG